MIKYILIIFLVFFAVRSMAYQSIATGFDYVLQAPPPINDIQGLYQYFYTIYSQWMTAQITTTFPNGNIDGGYGLTAVYFDGTNYWLMIQTAQPTGSTWVGTKLGTIT